MRNATAQRIRDFYAGYFAALDPRGIYSLVTLTVALADGLVVASEVEEVDLGAAFDLMASAILGAAQQLVRSIAC